MEVKRCQKPQICRPSLELGKSHDKHPLLKGTAYFAIVKIVPTWCTGWSRCTCSPSTRLQALGAESIVCHSLLRITENLICFINFLKLFLCFIFVGWVLIGVPLNGKLSVSEQKLLDV